MKNQVEFVRNIYSLESQKKVCIENNDDQIKAFLSKGYSIKDVKLTSSINDKGSFDDTKQSIFVEIFILEKTLWGSYEIKK